MQESPQLVVNSPDAPVRKVRASANAVLAIVAVAQFMVVLDASVVNVALPSIQRDVGFSEQSLSWVLNAYTLLFGGFLLLGGRAADRLGRRRLFMAGIALFSVASLACGLSQSEATLLIARGAQGLGGAMVSPAALSIILTTFAEGSERNRALAVWGAIAGAGGAVGVLLGGVIVQVLSWRWVFFINVPIGAAVLLLAPRIVPESRAEGVRGGYDVEGATAITLGTMALVFTLIKANDWGWGSARTLAGLAVAAALLVGFVWIERRHENPLVPLRIFSNRSLAASDGTMLLLAAALFGVFFFCSLYLQQVLGYNALKTGVAYLPLTAVIMVASGAAAQLVPRVGARPLLLAGAPAVAGGLYWLSRLGEHSSYAGAVLGPMLVIAVGFGLLFVPLTLVAMSRVADEETGVAASLRNTGQQVGGSIGLAVFGTVAWTVVANSVHAQAARAAAAAARAGYPERPSQAALTAIYHHALAAGFSRAFLVASGVMLLGLIIAIVAIRVRRADLGEARF